MDASNLKPGKEQSEYFYSDVMKKNLLQYDYRAFDGSLFSCVAPNIENARAHRDDWAISGDVLGRAPIALCGEMPTRSVIAAPWSASGAVSPESKIGTSKGLGALRPAPHVVLSRGVGRRGRTRVDNLNGAQSGLNGGHHGHENGNGSPG